MTDPAPSPSRTQKANVEPAQRRLRFVTVSGDLTGTYLIVASRDDGTVTLKPWGTLPISVTGATAGLRDGALYDLVEDDDGRRVLGSHSQLAPGPDEAP